MRFIGKKSAWGTLVLLLFQGVAVAAPTEAVPQEAGISGDLPKLDPSQPPARGVIELVRQSPKRVKLLDSGVTLVDFGKVAFGNLELTTPADFEGTLKVRFGEKLQEGVIDRKPPGTVRYSEVEVQVGPGETIVIAPPADERNTQQSGKARRPGVEPPPPAVLTPSEWGVVFPFRWIEIEGMSDVFPAEQVVRRAAFPKHWDEDAAKFVCSDETLNRVWGLCRDSIKATMFAGVYVDGDRERIPYEADAYLNQLSHYYTDHDPSMARDTVDWLLAYPTWPTEWGPHMVFMAHAEWMQNGDAEWIAKRYDRLKSRTLFERCRESGLVHSDQEQIKRNDIVDWPPVERDGYVRSEVNTVVNAFHIAAIEKMAELAVVAGKDEDARRYRDHAKEARRVFRNQLFNRKKGLYRDGLGVNHYALHASLFPLAFGLVKKKDRPAVVEWLSERGMRCSTYASQYLLEGLFENGAGGRAVELIIAPGKRSWRHMLDSDATITWESWNEEVKPNLDWNHAWGAAPANLLPRYVLGVQPLAPGWTRARIRPNPSGLEFARGTVPTALGPVSVDWSNDKAFKMTLKLPAEMRAAVQVPTVPDATAVYVNGQAVEAELEDGYWTLAEDLTGHSEIEVR